MCPWMVSGTRRYGLCLLNYPELNCFGLSNAYPYPYNRDSEVPLRSGLTIKQ